MGSYWNRRPASYSSRDAKHPLRPVLVFLVVAGLVLVVCTAKGWL